MRVSPGAKASKKRRGPLVKELSLVNYLFV